MIQTQLVDIKFDAGTTTKTDDKNTLYTSFTEMKNSRTDLLGAVRPRGGILEEILTSVNQPNLTGPGFGVVANPQYEIHLNKGSAWRITEASEAVSGSELRGSVSRLALGNASNGVIAAAKSGSAVCTAWADGTGSTATLNVQVQTFAGQVIVQELIFPFDTVTQIGVAFADSRFYIIYTTDLAGGTFNALVVSFAEITTLTGVTWAAKPAAGTVIWDLESDGTNIFLYYALGATTTPTLSKIVPLGSVFGAPTNVVVSGGLVGNITTLAILGLDAFGTGATIAVSGASNSSSGFLQYYNTALAQVGLTIPATGITGTPTQAWIAQKDTLSTAFGFAGRVGTTSDVLHHRLYHTPPAAAASVDPPSTYQLYLLSKPVYLDGQLVFLTDSTTVPTYGSQMLAQAIPATTLLDCVFSLGVSKNLGNTNIAPARRLARPLFFDTKVFIPACYIGSVTSLALTAPIANSITRVDTGASTQASLLTIDQAAYPSKFLDASKRQGVLLGSAPRHVASYRQIASPWPEPTIDTGVGRLDVNTAPATPFTGTVSCVFAKKITFPDGTVYRLYSPIFTAALSASAIRYVITSTDLTTPGWSQAAKKEYEFYKTETDGTIFYLATTHSSSGTFTDATLTPALLSGRLADINGNELFPETAPGVRAITAWKDRLVVLGADSGTVLKFNKPSIAPQGTYFADGLELDVGTEGGDVTALGSMDSTLYVFKQNQIMTVYGDPAGATGDNGSLSTPTVLRQGLGTVDPRSVILTPRGLMFNSQKGFYMIMRNQEWQFVGTGPYADRQVLLTGSAIDDDQAEVYFSYADGSVWVYNYESNQWYKWLLADTLRGVSTGSGKLVGSTDFGFFEYFSGGNTDFREGVGIRDIPQTYTTGWLRSNDIRGYQRVKRAYFTGAVSGSTTLTIQVFVDYQPTAVQTFTFPLTAVDPLNLDLHLAVQKCEAMRFKFSTTGAMLTLSGGSLEFGVKSGPDKSRTSGTNQK